MLFLGGILGFMLCSILTMGEMEDLRDMVAEGNKAKKRLDLILNYARSHNCIVHEELLRGWENERN